MPRKKTMLLRGLKFETGGRTYDDLDESLKQAALESFHIARGAYTTVLVYADDDRAAFAWGGEEGVRMFRSLGNPSEPLATVQVQAKCSYWR